VTARTHFTTDFHLSAEPPSYHQPPTVLFSIDLFTGGQAEPEIDGPGNFNSHKMQDLDKRQPKWQTTSQHYCDM